MGGGWNQVPMGRGRTGRSDAAHPPVSSAFGVPEALCLPAGPSPLGDHSIWPATLLQVKTKSARHLASSWGWGHLSLFQCVV